MGEVFSIGSFRRIFDESRRYSPWRDDLYLRRIKIGNEYRFVIRESRWEDECWKSRDLLDLGEDPARLIEYPGGNGYYFSPEVESALQKEGVEYCSEDLEDLFLPFFERDIRQIIERFKRSAGRTSRWSKMDASELSALQAELHSFDKRRLHYLRCGRIDIGELDGKPWKFLNVLLGKSRDEIEHIIEGMEQELRPQEVRSYLYTGLYLERYFSHRLTRHYPGALSPETVDDAFLESLCGLNRDECFFRGVEREGARGLHPYLVKYVILYFDHDFDRDRTRAEYAKRFASGWQFSERSPAKSSMPRVEACQLLGIAPEKLRKMSRIELTRHYRRQAKRLHPDKGGDHEQFIRMTEAYESLLAGR